MSVVRPAPVDSFENKPPRVRDLLLRASMLDGRTVPPRAWLWPEWIPGGNVTMITSDGGGGKTTLGLQLGVAVVTGTPWLGQTPATGPVLYISAEDDLDEMHRRLDEICVGLGVALNALTDLHLWPLADQDAVLAIEGQDGQVAPTARWAELLEMVGDIKPALVVLDSLADIFGGNENVRSQARQFIGLLRRIAMMTGGAVLVLSHPSLAGMSSGSGSSGSTAWSNSVRSRIYLTRPDDADADPDVRVLSLRKSNYARAQADMLLRRQVGGFVLEGGAGGSTRLDVTAQRRRVDGVFLDLLTAYGAQGRTVSDKPGANYAPAVFARDALAKGIAKSGFIPAMNRLLHAGEIRVEMIGRPSRQLRQLVRIATGEAVVDA